MASILEPSKSVSTFNSVLISHVPFGLFSNEIYFYVDLLNSDLIWELFVDFSVILLSLQSFFPAMTKIVGTLGPKSRSAEVISGCLKAGMSGMRLLLSRVFFQSVACVDILFFARFVSRIVMVFELVRALFGSGPI